MSSSARDDLFKAVHEATAAMYGERLIAMAIFGSWARGAATPASDLDLLIVADPLPPSRMKRVREFRPVANATRAVRSRVWSDQGPEIELSPVFKTPEELAAGSPLYLDMTLWSVVLFDRGGMLEAFLAGLRERMRALGSRRVPFKGGAFWDYKPDFRPGDVVELALKGMLRWAGIDPPKIHDVGDLVLQFAERFKGVSGHELTALAEASKELRKEREFSFYGDIDFIPTDEYDAADADTALGQARLATACLGRLLG